MALEGLIQPPLPTPPTDSYYKFKAIGGLWLVLAVTVLSWGAVIYTEREIFDLEIKVAIETSDVDSLKVELKNDELEKAAIGSEDQAVDKEAEGIDQEMKQLEAEKTPSKERLKHIEDRLGRFEKRFDAVHEKHAGLQQKVRTAQTHLQQISKAAAINDVSRRRLGTLANHVKGILIVGWGYLFFGLWHSTHGFSGWRRLQEMEEEASYGPEMILRHTSPLQKAFYDLLARVVRRLKVR